MTHRATLLLLALAAGSGCLGVVSRPMRTVEGPGITVGAARLVGAESEQTCTEDCMAEPVTWVSAANNDTRWGHMMTEHIGLSGGAVLAAPGARRNGVLQNLVGYGQVTLQNEQLSVATSLELGLNVISPVLGVDVQPWGGGGLRPNLSVYARRSAVLVRTIDDNDIEAGGFGVTGGEDSSFDVGASFRSGPLLVQYALFRLDEGRIGFGVVEGSTEARSWHVLLVGLELDHRSVAWLRSIGR